MQLNEHQLTTIVYEGQASKETTARVIIPVQVPHDYIRAVDVSDLSPQDRLKMQELLTEYGEYRARIAKQAFSFEDYVEQVRGEVVEPKWRTFKLANIK